MDRFELENKITNFHSFSDNLRSLANSFLEGRLDRDGLANGLEGLAVLIDVHTDETFDVFCDVFKLDGYSEIY
jgi:hypothetical protein